MRGDIFAPLESLVVERFLDLQEWLPADEERWRAYLAEVALAASALAELRHGKRNAGNETLKPLLSRG